MAKLTKAQKKRLVKEILSKSTKLYTQDFPVIMSMKDYDAIRRAMDRTMKKIEGR